MGKKELTLINEGFNEVKIDKLKKLNELQNAPRYERLKILVPSYKPNTPAAIGWHNALQLIRGIKGGVGSGKTHMLCADDILTAYDNAPYKHLNTSPSFDNALETVLPEYMKLCDESSLQYDWIEKKNSFIIEHSDRISTIKIFGADKPKFFKGVNAASGSMNEPFSQKKEAFTIWWERIRIKAAKHLSRVWGGTAEPKTMQWGKEYFDKKFIDTPDLYAITITTWDNEKNLHPDYIPNLLKKYDTRMQKVYMHGLMVDLAAGSAYNFNRDKNIMPLQTGLNRMYKIQNKTIVLSFDFNINPMTCTEAFIDAPEDIQIDEYKIGSSNTREIARVVASRISRRYKKDIEARTVSFKVTGDGSGLKGDTRSQDRFYNDYTIIKEELEAVGINAAFILPENGQNPHVHDSVEFLNSRYEKQLSWVCDNCTNTITDLCAVTWKQGADKFYLNKSNADETHLSDTVRYRVWWMQPILTEPGKKKPAVKVTYSSRWR